MKILLWSCAFSPSVGGIEKMSETLGVEFTNMGHKVTVVTRTSARPGDTAEHPFSVIRNPSWIQMMRLVAACDVFIHNHLSLKAAVPLLFFRRRWLVVYQTWYPKSGIRGWLLPFVSKFATVVACSKAVAAKMDPACIPIPNAYDERTFHLLPECRRTRELVFVGRLIKDKGVHVLLNALATLRSRGMRPRLTVVGIGHLKNYLVQKTNDLGLQEQVEFIGARHGGELAEVLNGHQILVVPSLWHEPFGIVALEGIACGCIVVGSEGGGLKEAIGPCGVTFPNGDAEALANALTALLEAPEKWSAYYAAAGEHLRKHTSVAVAGAYLAALTSKRERQSVPERRLASSEKPPEITSSSAASPARILLWTCSFYPAIGGIETMAEILGREFTALGRHVTLVTRTVAPSGADAKFPFTVVRSPGLLRLLHLVANCDVFVHNHLSVKVAFPLLFFRRPWVVVYHCEYPTSGIRGLLQPLVARFALSVACSKALAEFTNPQCRVLPNAYDDAVFKRIPEVVRDRELVFVGRLITDKGLQVLLDALALMRDNGISPRLCVVGEGPDQDLLVAKTVELNLAEQVKFIGKKSGGELARILNRHRILVVPSLVRESFGIVALEAIACGCIVVGSESGGLKEAIGPCGTTFPTGDASALAQTLAGLLLAPATWSQYYQSAATHLQKHSARAVAVAYLSAIGDFTNRNASRRPMLSSARFEQSD